MYTRVNAIAISIIIIITIMVAMLACMYGTQTSVQSFDGKTFINTTNGIVELKDVEYLSTAINFVAPAPIMPQTPSTLPNTSAPHGTYTCDMGGFTVTNDTPCNER